MGDEEIAQVVPNCGFDKVSACPTGTWDILSLCVEYRQSEARKCCIRRSDEWINRITKTVLWQQDARDGDQASRLRGSEEGGKRADDNVESQSQD